MNKWTGVFLTLAVGITMKFILPLMSLWRAGVVGVLVMVCFLIATCVKEEPTKR